MREIASHVVEQQFRPIDRKTLFAAAVNAQAIARAVAEFDEAGRMRPSYYNCVVETMQELMKFAPLVRDRSAYLTRPLLPAR